MIIRNDSFIHDIPWPQVPRNQPEWKHCPRKGQERDVDELKEYHEKHHHIHLDLLYTVLRSLVSINSYNLIWFITPTAHVPRTLGNALAHMDVGEAQTILDPQVIKL